MGKFIAWIIAHWAAITAIGGALVTLGQRVHQKWPGLPARFPRLQGLLELGSAWWPDLEKAAPALLKLITGSSKPKVPPLPLFLTLLALTGCPTMPKPDGCTPHDQRCWHGVPQICSPGQRWTPADSPCAPPASECCLTPSAFGGPPIYACVPKLLCLVRDQ